jgi:integrase
VRVLLAAAADVDAALACWLQVAVATGARRGEICGLRWNDIDLGDASVRIQRSVSATRQAGLTIKSTKTGGVRVVSLTTQAVIALREHHRSTHPGAADAFVFSNDADGARPWRPDLVTRRWERLRRTGHFDRRVRIHDLRHFVATELLCAGIDVRTVANRLGHARTSTTLDIYWAWVPARDRDAAAHLALLLAADQ